MKKSKLINVREISRRLTGSPDKIRHDFVPHEYRGLVKKMETLVEGILQEQQKPVKKITNFERR